MAVRIQTYVGLLYQDLIRTQQLTEARLPPPPVVLYNGTAAWTAKTDVSDLIQPVTGLLADYRPRQRYPLLDKIRLAETGNLQRRNLSAALFRLEASRGPTEVMEVLKALIGLQAPNQASLRRAFTVWLQRVFLPRRLPGVNLVPMSDLSEIHSMVSGRFESWMEMWERQGVERGLQQGLQQSLQRQRHGLRRLVCKRFGVEVAPSRERCRCRISTIPGCWKICSSRCWTALMARFGCGYCDLW
jgi:hypothetical protein